MENQNNKFGTIKYHLIQILKNFPKSNIVFTLIIVIKFIPLFVLSHDWKISKNSGISYWVRKFTFSEIFNSFKNIYFLYLLLYFYSFLTLISLILSFYQIFTHKYNEKYICFIQYISLILNYMLTSYFLSIFVEIIFDDRSRKEVNSILFYVSVILICFNVIFIFFVEILFSSLVIQEPFFIDNHSNFTNALGRIDLTFLFITLIQIPVQLEFHMTDDNIILVKIIARFFFV